MMLVLLPLLIFGLFYLDRMDKKYITMNEIWKTAIYKDEIYEGLYKVSNLGRILSLDYNHTGKPGLMNPWEDKDGYFKVELWKNGESKTCYAHRLVAETFLPNPENKPQVNHKIEGDEGKKINMVIFNTDGSINKEKSTIEWVTPKENSNYATRNERIAKAKINGKRSKKVLQLSLSGDLIREWPSTAECGRNGFSQSAVSLCCNGKKTQYKGFRFMFADDYKEKQLKEVVETTLF